MGSLKRLRRKCCGQDEVTEKAVKRARKEREYPFKHKGNREQFVFNDSIDDKPEFAKQQLCFDIGFDIGDRESSAGHRGRFGPH